MGGGTNHRMRLNDAILIKDNHIALCGGVTQAFRRAQAANNLQLPIEVECDTLEQVKEALEAGVRSIMLDNMSLDEMRQAVELVAGKATLEASGNVSLDTVRAIAQTGINFISVGKLTHSAPNIDIGLDMVMTS
jgi:nicotinate-nucleotide pyrophosphorylase (carboxylating)